MSKCPFSAIASKLGLKKPENHDFFKQNNELNRKVNIDLETRYKKQLNVIDLTKEDLALSKQLAPIISDNIDHIVNVFYDSIELEPSLVAIIKDNSSREKLQVTLRAHIQELFLGVIDEEFVEKRARIANMHVKIGLPTKWYIASFQNLLMSILEILDNNIENKQEFAKGVQIVTKLLNLEQQLVLEAYEDEMVRIKTLMSEEKQLLIDKVSNSTIELAAIAQQTYSSIENMTNQTNQVARMAQEGNNLSKEVQIKSNQGSDQVTEQYKNMHEIKNKVTEISNDVKNLEEISSQIKDIVGIVKGIADQTNLLALNASIEAARAGEHGRGFAVVAQEVRKLAEQTKKSVQNVTDLIEQTSSQVNNVSSSIDKIKVLVEKGNDGMSKTKEYFDEIIHVMNESREQSLKIEEEINSFVVTMHDISEASQRTNHFASDLSLSAESL